MFTSEVSQIRHAAFVAREDSDRAGLKAEIDSVTYDPEASDSWSNHTMGQDDSFVIFATSDYDALLRFVQLDLVGIRQLYVMEDVDEPMGDSVGGGDTGVNGAGAGGGIVKNVEEGAGQNVEEVASVKDELVGGI